MNKIMPQEKERPVLDEIERELRIQSNMSNTHWRSHRYDYYCGDWRHTWHEGRQIEHPAGGVTGY
jgi:hypothetical protein